MGFRFTITEQPRNSTMDKYIKILEKEGVTHLVCCTERQYDTAKLVANGIAVHELSYPDGSAPGTEIVEQWLSLVSSVFSADPATTMGVHCVTGLGRAPVLVCIALIEQGMKYEDAVEHMRKTRPGAINTKQLQFLANYKRRNYFSKQAKRKLSCIAIKEKCKIQ